MLPHLSSHLFKVMAIIRPYQYFRLTNIMFLVKLLTHYISKTMICNLWITWAYNKYMQSTKPDFLCSIPDLVLHKELSSSPPEWSTVNYKWPWTQWLLTNHKGNMCCAKGLNLWTPGPWNTLSVELLGHAYNLDEVLYLVIGKQKLGCKVKYLK